MLELDHCPLQIVHLIFAKITSSRSKNVLLPFIGKVRAGEFFRLRLPTSLEVLQRYISLKLPKQLRVEQQIQHSLKL